MTSKIKTITLFGYNRIREEAYCKDCIDSMERKMFSLLEISINNSNDHLKCCKCKKVIPAEVILRDGYMYKFYK